MKKPSLVRFLSYWAIGVALGQIIRVSNGQQFDPKGALALLAVCLACWGLTGILFWTTQKIIGETP